MTVQTTGPRPRPEILAIAPYVGGESKMAGQNHMSNRLTKLRQLPMSPHWQLKMRPAFLT